jgi:hypothetical protein
MALLVGMFAGVIVERHLVTTNPTFAQELLNEANENAKFDELMRQHKRIMEEIDKELGK